MKNETAVVDINSLTPDDMNGNLGTARGEAMVADSVERHGAGRSILIDRNGKVIAGNKTLEAAKKAGITTVRIIETVGDEVVAVKRTDIDLDDASGRELALLDNRTGQVNLEWGGEALEQLEQRGVNLGSAFFTEELDRIITRATAVTQLAEATPAGGGKAAAGGPAVSQVRMAQLYFDTETFGRFNESIERLEAHFETEGTVATVVAAMRAVLASANENAEAEA